MIETYILLLARPIYFEHFTYLPTFTIYLLRSMGVAAVDDFHEKNSSIMLAYFVFTILQPGSQHVCAIGFN
jgi:hypothetical protein